MHASTEPATSGESASTNMPAPTAEPATPCIGWRTG
jgi:hypothetical protein